MWSQPRLPQTLGGLKVAIRNVWVDLDQDFIRRVFTKMVHRLRKL